MTDKNDLSQSCATSSTPPLPPLNLKVFSARRGAKRDWGASTCLACACWTRTAATSFAGCGRMVRPSDCGLALLSYRVGHLHARQARGRHYRPSGGRIIRGVAEELFASDCRLLVSLTSAGQIMPAGEPPYFVVIERALRDEGTSYHYAAPSEFAEADQALVAKAAAALASLPQHSVIGSSWTTDAPFRETAAAIEWANSKGILERFGVRRAFKDATVRPT